MYKTQSKNMQRANIAAKKTPKYESVQFDNTDTKSHYCLTCKVMLNVRKPSVCKICGNESEYGNCDQFFGDFIFEIFHKFKCGLFLRSKKIPDIHTCNYVLSVSPELPWDEKVDIFTLKMTTVSSRTVHELLTNVDEFKSSKQRKEVLDIFYKLIKNELRNNKMAPRGRC